MPIDTVTPDVTIRVSEVAYTPLTTYITLEMDPNENALVTFKAENGEGFYNEDGILLWEYSGIDVYSAWIISLELVDGKGDLLFPGHRGNNGCSETWAEFIYPYMDTESLPEQLWLAPVNDNIVDMTYAIRVK